MLACRLTGHRVRFAAEGNVLRWRCERGCGFGGEKTYDSPERARRYAEAFENGEKGTPGRFPIPIPRSLLRKSRSGE
jgi:hypothetical protein